MASNWAKVQVKTGSAEGFRWHRARAVCQKDLLELFKNRGLLASMLALPLTLVVVPLGVVWSYVRNPLDPNLVVVARYFEKGLPAERVVDFLVEKTLVDWLSLYLIMPVFVPILLSSHAIAGEKEKRTLEPLLATPVTGLELMVGKSLASLFPAMVVCWVAFACLCVGVDLLSVGVLHRWVLPNGMWTYGVLVLAPLFAFFGNGLAVGISARVGDARLSQQLAGMFVLPLVASGAAQFGGWLRAGVGYYLGMGALMLGVDAVLLWLAPKWFDRERLISKWG